MSSRKEMCMVCTMRMDCSDASTGGPIPYCSIKLEADMKEPRPKVQLTGNDGNAFVIIGMVGNALSKAGQTEACIVFWKEAMSGDYNHLLQTAMKYVEVS